LTIFASKLQVPSFKFQIQRKKQKNGKKNDLCERLLKLAVDVILFFLGLWTWNLGLGIFFCKKKIYVT
jgi:hypothetical protein